MPRRRRAQKSLPGSRDRPPGAAHCPRFDLPASCSYRCDLRRDGCVEATQAVQKKNRRDLEPFLRRVNRVRQETIPFLPFLEGLFPELGDRLQGRHLGRGQRESDLWPHRTDLSLSSLVVLRSMISFCDAFEVVVGLSVFLARPESLLPHRRGDGGWWLRIPCPSGNHAPRRFHDPSVRNADRRPDPRKYPISGRGPSLPNPPPSPDREGLGLWQGNLLPRSTNMDTTKLMMAAHFNLFSDITHLLYPFSLCSKTSETSRVIFSKLNGSATTISIPFSLILSRWKLHTRPRYHGDRDLRIHLLQEIPPTSHPESFGIPRSVKTRSN